MKNEVSDYNDTSRPQACIHPQFGCLLRGIQSKYFRQVDESKSAHIVKHQRRYNMIPHDLIPRNMIRKMSKDEDDLRLMCTGCGKMFKRDEMDGSLCRGFDGCSVNAEISKLNIFNVQRRETSSHLNRYVVH